MAYPTYSSTGLPHSPLADSWQCPQMYQDPLQTDMEGGNKRLRARPGDAVARYTFAILFTKAQFTTFKEFVADTLGGGTARFVMSVWDGTDHVLKVVQFAAAPKPEAAEPKVRVVFDIWAFRDA